MRGKWRVGLIGVISLAAVGAFLARDQIALAQIGTSFAAKQTCSCLFVSGRPLESCKGDYNPTAAHWFSWRVEQRSVTVSALLVFSSTAIFEEGFGCHLAR